MMTGLYDFSESQSVRVN